MAGWQYSVKIVTEDDQSSPAGGLGAINKLIQQGIGNLVEKTNQPFTMESMLSLDAFYPLLQCIERANSFDPDKVVSAIESMSSIDTIYGKGRWGGQELYGVNHVILRPITISRIVNGKVEQLDFISN